MAKNEKFYAASIGKYASDCAAHVQTKISKNSLRPDEFLFRHHILKTNHRNQITEVLRLLPAYDWLSHIWYTGGCGV